MKRQVKRRALLLAGIASIPAVLTADDLFFGRRLRTRCRLPPYNYQTQHFGNPVGAGSFKAIAYLVDGSNAAPGVLDPGSNTEVLKTFQMDQLFLERDHCRIEQVAVTISSSGNWMLHMLATQNPALVDARQRPQFERFARNLFQVDVRPVGLMTLPQTEGNAAIAKPEYPCIEPQRFWIQKDQSKRVRARGCSPELARYFHVIEQVEIHFSYR